MKKRILVGIIFSCFLLLITPTINAIHYNEIQKEIKQQYHTNIKKTIDLPLNIFNKILQFFAKIIALFITLEIILIIVNNVLNIALPLVELIIDITLNLIIAFLSLLSIDDLIIVYLILINIFLIYVLYEYIKNIIQNITPQTPNHSITTGGMIR